MNETGRPVTAFRNSKPWVLVAPVGKGVRRPHAQHRLSKQDVVKTDAGTRGTVLPAEWGDPEDDGLYDDLA